MYTFYEEKQHFCKHQNKMNPLHFMGLSPALQLLTKILSNKDNYDEIMKNNERGRNGFKKETFTEDQLIFDIEDGLILKLARYFGYYLSASICLTLVVWTDCFTLEDGRSICVVLASINELGFDKRTKEQKIFPLAVMVCYSGLDQSVFQPVVDLLKSLFNDKNIVTVYHYSIENEQIKTEKHVHSIKCAFIGINKDKGMTLDVFNTKPNGFCSCTDCLQPGEYTEGAVHFPKSNSLWPIRTEDYAIECNNIRLFLKKKTYGGHHGLSVWSQIRHFDLYAVLNINDPMHDFDGIIDLLFSFLTEEDWIKLKELSKSIKLTKETHAHYGNSFFFHFF